MKQTLIIFEFFLSMLFNIQGDKSKFMVIKANYLSMSNVQVMEAWMGSGKSANIRCLDLDRSNIIMTNNMTFIIDRPDKY